MFAVKTRNVPMGVEWVPLPLSVQNSPFPRNSSSMYVESYKYRFEYLRTKHKPSLMMAYHEMFVTER